MKNINEQKVLNLTPSTTKQEISKTTINKAQKDKTITNCKSFGNSWELFTKANTTLSFCYQPVWGKVTIKEAQIDPNMKVGKMYYVSFDKLKNKEHILISYSTPDFKRTGARDTWPDFEWSKLDFNKDVSQLVSLLPELINAKGLKLIANNKQVLKVNGEIQLMGDTTKTKMVDYFIPNVTINGKVYNLKIGSTAGMEDEADKVLESLTFEK